MTHSACSPASRVAIVCRVNPKLSQFRLPPERRGRTDRRRRIWWSICYGSFNPRRRAAPRRRDESKFHSLDWHSRHLLAVAIAISLLCVGDAFLTLVLLQGGAFELNPLMAELLYRSVAAFAAWKMAMTGTSIVLMVVLARYRFMRLLRVEWVLYGVLMSYAGLIGYEVWLLKSLGGPPIL